MLNSNESVADCLRHSFEEKELHPAVANHRALTTDHLGKAKYRGLDPEQQQILQQVSCRYFSSRYDIEIVSYLLFVLILLK